MLSEIEIDQDLKTCCKNVYSRVSDIDPIDTCKSTQNNKCLWKENRKLRITGSRCYEIFTYSINRKSNWQNKSINYFYPTSVCTPAMKHGIINESHARQAYENKYQTKVTELGLVISHDNPFLGYSPDGVTFSKEGISDKLIEVKCPYNGSTMTADVFKILKFIDQSNRTLKVKHKYYGQVQKYENGVGNDLSSQ